MKQYNTFNVIINGNAYTFSIIGYDTKYIEDISVYISEILNIMKSRGDFKNVGLHGAIGTYDAIGNIINEFWKHRVHLDYKYPTFGTFNLTE